MGVHNLWELLAPVGRRVSVETLAGKKLAIDASIWMIQFMKAMRDEKGEMVRNAHLLGFFRRICKLLFLRTKPVFVFDGGTPALKRRTVIARRRQRENAQTKIRKTAEKLLLNHLKAMKLKELAKDIENQKKNTDVKGKKVLSDQTDMMGNNSEKDDIILNSYNQEQLDEMLAASLAAEEDGIFTGDASTSAAGIPSEEDDGDEDEEMILPTMHGKVDPAVLAALPPSMQLDLLGQMRERLMAENRQKYQKVKKAPSKFSELQIQSYLKTVAFRREIDDVQKSAAGRGVGGVQTSRIASEANREFIFSSSFTGDKHVLTSAGVERNGDKSSKKKERNGDKQSQKPSECPSGTLDSIASTVMSSTATGSIMDEPRRVHDDDVETYLDERGRVRVSRVRAMGIRMTRDLQRNLDMMKEIEQERTNSNKIVDFDSILNKNIPGVPRSYPNKNQFQENSPESNDETGSLNNGNEQSLSKNETSIEISFEDDSENKHLDGDDDLFARLVAGDPEIISSVDNTSSKKKSSDSASDSDWEEGVIEEKVDSHTNDVKAKTKPSFEGSISDGSEVEWEEGVHDVPKNASPCPSDHGKVISRGSLEEEADFQEAIRRSLEDLRGEKSIDVSSEKGNIERAGEMAHERTMAGFLHQENVRSDPNLALKNVFQQKGPSHEIVAGVEKPDSMDGMNVSQTIDASGQQLMPSVASNSNYLEVLIDKPWEKFPGSHPDILKQDANESGNLKRKLLCTESVAPIETKVNLSAEQLLDGSNEGDEVSTLANSCPRNSSCFSDTAFHDMPDAILPDACKNDSGAAPTCHSNETIDPAVYKNDCEAAPYSNETIDPALFVGGSSVKEATTGIDVEPKFVEKKDGDNFIMEREHNLDDSAIKDNKKVQVEVTEASLEEEMLILGQERINLGEEQRKQERNAESVSSEMFAECQELLQMFGLPYIIAPMEAEAQCAYMELANLVDGVVTDDSDVFLFGARNVYKNIFDDRKYVETYFMKDIENELGLTREKLIRMALLLGSDYTEGISGIGIVNAIEVVNAFPEEDGLHKFRVWIESPDPTILGKFVVQTGSSSRKRGSKVSDDMSRSESNTEGVSASDPNVSQVHEHEQSVDYIQDIKQSFMHKHRTVSKNWHIPSSFPSEAVISAYASPQVDKSTEPFSWGKPDLFVLRKSCWEKFGWTSQKADELLLPVLKEYSKHETQLRLEAFYTFNERFAKIRSKRIKKAVKGITGNPSLELMDDAAQEVSKHRKKRRASPSEPGSEKLSNGIENSFAGDESNSMAKSPSKQSRKRKIHGNPIPLEVKNPKPHMQAEGRQSTNRGSGGNRRGRGRGRGQQVGKGRRKGSPCFEFTESSSSDGNNANKNEDEFCTEKLEEPPEVRRSTRSRKPVNYAVNDFEIDDAGKSLDQNDEECTGEEAVEQEPSLSRDTCGDAAGGLTEKNQHKSGDPLHEEGSCEDYLETGGGFCMDEEETGELSTMKNGDPSFETDFSKDCLKMGGGFCIEEGETDKDPDEYTCNPASATVHENADPSHCSGSMDKAEHDIQPVQSAYSLKTASDGIQDEERIDAFDTGQNRHCLNATSNNVSNVVASVQENTKGDSGPISTRAFSAMPFLRRKRRKS